MTRRRADVPRGTLDLMILRTLSLEPLHGYGMAQRIGQVTQGAFEISPGSFFPSLYRLEQRGWIRGSWGISENGRRARTYELTPAGRKRLTVELRNWDRVTLAIRRVLNATS